MEEQYNDEEIFRRIKARDEPFIALIYEYYWRSFYPFILKIGQLEEANIKEIYLQAFAVFCYKIQQGELKWPMRSSLKTYLFGVGKIFLRKFWDKRKGDRLRFDELPEESPNQQIEQDIEGYYEQKDRRTFLAACLKKVGERCQQILHFKYFLDFADDAIAREMNIPSEGAVRQLRFKCLKKIRDLFN